MVGEGTIDLATAQREMAVDWISAYKKYLDTDKPLLIDSHRPRRPESEPEIENPYSFLGRRRRRLGVFDEKLIRAFELD